MRVYPAPPRWFLRATHSPNTSDGFSSSRSFPPLFVSYVANPPSGFLMLSSYEEMKVGGACFTAGLRHGFNSLTTLTASNSRWGPSGSLTEGHSSCSSITDFRPSAVQSATIQPQSLVLKGKPPCRGAGGLRPTVDRFHLQRVFLYLVHLSVELLVLRRVFRNLSGTKDRIGSGESSLQNQHLFFS